MDNGAAGANEVAAVCMRSASHMFKVYGTDKLHTMERFCYLRPIFSHNDNNVPAMRRNLKQDWATLGQILKKTGPRGDIRTRGEHILSGGGGNGTPLRK